MLRCHRADKIDDKNGEKRGQRGVDGSYECLGDGSADYFVKRFRIFHSAIVLQIFPGSVKDDDGIVYGEAENDKNRSDKKRINLIAVEKMIENDKYACRNNHIMAERDD